MTLKFRTYIINSWMNFEVGNSSRKSIAEKLMYTKVASSSNLESKISSWKIDLMYLSVGATRYVLTGATNLP